MVENSGGRIVDEVDRWGTRVRKHPTAVVMWTSAGMPWGTMLLGNGCGINVRTGGGEERRRGAGGVCREHQATGAATKDRVRRMLTEDASLSGCGSVQEEDGRCRKVCLLRDKTGEWDKCNEAHFRRTEFGGEKGREGVGVAYWRRARHVSSE